MMSMLSIIAASRRRVIPYRTEVLRDNPVAYWRLGESSGTTAADETGTYPGTYVGSPTLGVTGAVAGNTAVLFNGTSQYVQRDITISNYPVTLECWVKLTNTSIEHRILQLANPSRSDEYLLLTAPPSRGWEMQLRNQGASFDSPGWPVASGGTIDTDWHHLVGVFAASGDCKLYLDGSVIATDTNSANFPPNQTRLGIAREMDSAPAFGAATIDEVAIYPTALSAARILAHYNARNNP
jgi:hypothetical protein